MEWVTTTLVLDRLREFDDDAWELFSNRFRRPVELFARRLGLPAAEAEDVAQETLLAFAQAHRAGKYRRERGRLRSWLFGIAHKQALARARRWRREAQVARKDADDASYWQNLADEKTARESFDTAWHETVLRECLERVRLEVEPKTVLAFERVVLGRESPAAVAEELGMTRNAVFLVKHRLLKRIRTLKQEFEGSENG